MARRHSENGSKQIESREHSDSYTRPVDHDQVMPVGCRQLTCGVLDGRGDRDAHGGLRHALACRTLDIEQIAERDHPQRPARIVDYGHRPDVKGAHQLSKFSCARVRANGEKLSIHDLVDRSRHGPRASQGVDQPPGPAIRVEPERRPRRIVQKAQDLRWQLPPCRRPTRSTQEPADQRGSGGLVEVVRCIVIPYSCSLY